MELFTAMLQKLIVHVLSHWKYENAGKHENLILDAPPATRLQLAFWRQPGTKPAGSLRSACIITMLYIRPHNSSITPALYLLVPFTHFTQALPDVW